MDIYKLVNKWRNSLKQESEKDFFQEKIQIKPELKTPSYHALLKEAEEKAKGTTDPAPTAPKSDKAEQKPVATTTKDPTLDKQNKTTTQQKPDTEKEETKTKITGKIKSSCKCVDASESALSVSKIKELLNRYYIVKKKDPSFKKLEVNDDCDLETQKAIMKFQAETGAEQDGCVGDETEGKMLDAGLIKKLTGGSSGGGGVSNLSGVGSIGSFAAGTTISIKSNVKGPSPAGRRLPAPNHHGYGRDTFTNNNTSNDAYMVNAVYMGDILGGAPGIRVGGSKIKNYCNPIIANLIKAAAAETTKYDRTGGLAIVANSSLGTCHNAKARRKDPSLPCIQGGWGKKGGTNTGKHRFGHQSGLEADITFYKMKGRGSWWDAVAAKFRNFDFERNCAFTEALLKSSQMEMVMIGPKVIAAMKKWVRKNGLEEKFPNVLSSPKLIRDSGKGGHDNHYHVRAFFPEGSPNMKQFMASVKSGEYGKSGQAGASAAVTSALANLKKQDPSKYSYVLGTIDGRIIESHNQNKQIYGASIQKPVAALAQLIQWSGNKSKQMNDKELGMLLAYSKTFRGSNQVNRAISKSFRGGRKFYKARNLGKIDPNLMKSNILNIFGISNTKFVYSNNRQSALDYFKFLSGLVRVSTPGNAKNTTEEQFARTYSKEIGMVIRAMKNRNFPSHIKKGLAASGIRNYWGKGGRALGALNYGLVIDEKYVLVVYTRFGSGGKIGSKEHAKSGSGGEHTNMVLAIINSLARKAKITG